MKTVLISSIALCLGLVAACDQPDDDIVRMNGRVPDWSIPAQYHGEWRADLANCGGPAEDSKLVVAAKEIQFPSATGKVMAASATSTGMTIVGEFKGEGMEWRQPLTLDLSPDGKVLSTAASAKGEVIARQKCP